MRARSATRRAGAIDRVERRATPERQDARGQHETAQQPTQPEGLTVGWASRLEAPGDYCRRGDNRPAQQKARVTRAYFYALNGDQASERDDR